MSDNKKYYYLKLKENFYESEEMIVLQNMPDGYLYTDILMKLYLRSLKNNGKLMFKDLIPYTPSVLAQVLRHQIGTVEKALGIFQKLGLIEVLDNGAIFMSEIQNFIGQGSSEGDRKKKYRERIKEEKIQLLKSGQMSDIRPPEIEIELEKEIDIELEKEVELEADKKSNFIFSVCKSKGIELSKNAEDFINNCLNNGMSPEIIIYAISEAIDHQIKNWSYIQKILNRYKFEGYKTIDEIKQDANSRNTENLPTYSKKFLNQFYTN